MSKRLYPRPKASVRKAAKENVLERPYHVQYSDPSGDLDPEWGHYNSELAVRTDAWYRVKLLGFHTEATLYDRDEMKQLHE